MYESRNYLFILEYEHEKGKQLNAQCQFHRFNFEDISSNSQRVRVDKVCLPIRALIVGLKTSLESVEESPIYYDDKEK